MTTLGEKNWLSFGEDVLLDDCKYFSLRSSPRLPEAANTQLWAMRQAPNNIKYVYCFSSSTRIDFCLWQEKKQTKKCVRQDKFAWTSTVLNSRREIDRLLDANYGIMETDGEGKFVSFKVVLGSTSLFKMNHGPASLDCLVSLLLEHWSS